MPDSYQRQLEVATQAAVAAGALLRDEFHHSGGARGGDGHADADDRAEALIHARLAAAFPAYGYRGEELGFKGGPRDPGRHTWIVDPNDGTNDFLRGYRGASVAIALVRTGLPVLGVVYAYSAPDDAGDLITWAEGCGPVHRNGVPLTRQWPTAVSEGVTVLVSTYADLRMEANLRVMAPMRFRGTPSIAYRLAMLAIGDADATVSLNSPNSWDYAAGHALLIGSGGLLIGGRGRLITYSEDGISRCGGSLYGGADVLVTELMDRDWKQVTGAYKDRHCPFCRPLKSHPVRDAARLTRAQGCMIGQLAGDSLGSLVEFLSPEEIKRRYPAGLSRLETGGVWGTLAGQPTDDSETALALARGLIKTGQYDAEAAREAYVAWYRSDPFDLGDTMCESLSTGKANVMSQANGSLMRVSPIGIAFGPERAQGAAREDAAITHAHPVCLDAAAVYAATISHAIRSGDDARAVYDWAVRRAAANGVDAAVRDALNAARNGAPADYLTQQGWVLVALQNAFYQLLHAGSVEAGLTDTVMRGGDTDTNAAIAGALLGAVHGLRAMPHQWTDRVLTCRPAKGMPWVKHPRPPEYWPIDALYLAERLLGLER